MYPAETFKGVAGAARFRPGKPDGYGGGTESVGKIEVLRLGFHIGQRHNGVDPYSFAAQGPTVVSHQLIQAGFDNMVVDRLRTADELGIDRTDDPYCRSPSGQNWSANPSMMVFVAVRLTCSSPRQGSPVPR